VADGRRGRRWRAVATDDDRITHALLLEVGLDGHVARLELTTPAGLLTLHPDADGSTLHGNVVSSTGVRHLSYPWGPDHAVAVVGRPIADAVTAHRLVGSVGVGEGRDVPTLAIGPDVALVETDVRFERVSDDAWRLSDASGDRTMTVDARGLPFAAEDAVEWPLELDEA
jgi:hypothetical protein